ncbi:MAG: EamA family transporter [Atopobiaceae bacterium]|nr:EamA family transporter [Atopobiaceae bacterium]
MDKATARLQYIIAVVIYGTNGTLLRFVDLPSEVVVLARGAGGALFILAFMRLRGMALDGEAIKRNLKWLIASGVCLGLNWIFLFAAYVHTTVAIASLCNYTAPLMVLAVSPIIFKERLGAKRLACVIGAAVGVSLVSGVFGSGGAGFDAVGIGLGMTAAVCFALIVIFNKQLSDIGSYERTVIQLGTSALTVLPYVVFMNGGIPLPHDALSLVIVAVLAFVHTGIAYIFYFGGMGTLPVHEVALLGYIEPVVSVLCSAFLLHEPLGLLGALGAALVIASAAAGELVEE